MEWQPMPDYNKKNLTVKKRVILPQNTKEKLEPHTLMLYQMLFHLEKALRQQ